MSLLYLQNNKRVYNLNDCVSSSIVIKSINFLTIKVFDAKSKMTSRINIISMNPSKGDTIHHTTFNSRRIIFVQSIFALIFLIQHQRFFPPSAFALQQPQQFVDDQQLQLTSTTQNYVSRIAGLTARIQCTLNRCAQAPATVRKICCDKIKLLSQISIEF